jgi:hypothetical protein
MDFNHVSVPQNLGKEDFITPVALKGRFGFVSPRHVVIHAMFRLEQFPTVFAREDVVQFNFMIPLMDYKPFLLKEMFSAHVAYACPKMFCQMSFQRVIIGVSIPTFHTRLTSDLEVVFKEFVFDVRV